MSAKDLKIICPKEIMQKIEEHCFSETKVEVGGFLVGHRKENITTVKHILKAKHASSKQSQLTFTNKTWESVWNELPGLGDDLELVGWFHSHPNFGVFLSDYDKFIQNQFFKDDGKITIVVDPIQGQRGWFYSTGGDVHPMGEIENTDKKKLAVSSSSTDENIEIKTANNKPGVSLTKAVLISSVVSLLISLVTQTIFSLGSVSKQGEIDQLKIAVQQLAVDIANLDGNNNGSSATKSEPNTATKSPTTKQTPKPTPSTSKVITYKAGEICTKENEIALSQDNKKLVCTKNPKDKNGKIKLTWKISSQSSAQPNTTNPSSPSNSSTSSPSTSQNPPSDSNTSKSP
jgi:proteasome lid subunit RPN8/RPN11